MVALDCCLVLFGNHEITSVVFVQDRPVGFVVIQVFPDFLDGLAIKYTMQLLFGIISRHFPNQILACGRSIAFVVLAVAVIIVITAVTLLHLCSCTRDLDPNRLIHDRFIRNFLKAFPLLRRILIVVVGTCRMILQDD